MYGCQKVKYKKVENEKNHYSIFHLCSCASAFLTPAWLAFTGPVHCLSPPRLLRQCTGPVKASHAGVKNADAQLQRWNIE